MTPTILLDAGARRELARLIAKRQRPYSIDPLAWHLLNMGALASLELQTLEALSNLVGPNLIQLLRAASEAASREEVPTQPFIV